MQTLIQVVCTDGPSIRERIVADEKLSKFKLRVQQSKKIGRSRGWLKLRSADAEVRGAINIEWRADTSILICRVVNKGSKSPSLIIGDFVYYLLARYSGRIQTINLFKR